MSDSGIEPDSKSAWDMLLLAPAPAKQARAATPTHVSSPIAPVYGTPLSNDERKRQERRDALSRTDGRRNADGIVREMLFSVRTRETTKADIVAVSREAKITIAEAFEQAVALLKAHHQKTHR